MPELNPDKFAETIMKRIADGGVIDARDEQGCTALHLAASQRNQDLMEWLIAQGANVNIKDNRGITAFGYMRGRQEMEELLLAAGADINAIGSGGVDFPYLTRHRG